MDRTLPRRLACLARPLAGLLAVVICSGSGECGDTELGGDVRYYQIYATEAGDQERRDAELGIARLKLTSQLSRTLRFEAHGALLLAAPGLATGATSLATGGTRRLLDLEDRFIDEDGLLGVVELDRLNLRWERPGLRLVAGRQTMSWGVSTFWPALDLFAPFPPQRIDREYKPGIDAVRLTVPLGALSEIEVVAAGQGPRIAEDVTVAGLGRFHVSGTDFGVMAGRFHQDIVLGVFVATDAWGAGLRGEVSFTDSGDEADAALGRESFLRATVGLDRPLGPTVVLSAEVAFNGFGAGDSGEYLQVARADRVSRGEVVSVGRAYAGASVAWQAHPLVSVQGAVLGNLGDGSTLARAFAEWSVSESVSALAGATLGLGPGSPAADAPRSEYGAVPLTLYGALKLYF